MKTLVVGDLHGQYELAEAALESGFPVVFLGDYLDSFTRSPVEQCSTLDLVVNAIEDREDVQGLVGNHELQYMNPKYRCSGFRHETREMLINSGLLVKAEKLLKHYTVVGSFMLSHAGVSKSFIKSLPLDRYLAAPLDYYTVGFSRGGSSNSGDMFWCDWRYEFEPLDDIPQIVGHTRGNHIRQRGNSYCIDVLENNNFTGLLINTEGGEEIQMYKLKTGEIVDCTAL